MSYAPHIRAYFQEFFNIYTGIGEWHGRLEKEVINTKKVRLPSGREYAFPNAERTAWGGVSFSTQWKNYPVQGHATADVVPCAVITVWREFKRLKLKSLLINCVHDSLVIDCHPDEIEVVVSILFDKLINVNKEFERRYGYKFNVPLACEVKVGDNWLTGKEVDNPHLEKAA